MTLLDRIRELVIGDDFISGELDPSAKFANTFHLAA